MGNQREINKKMKKQKFSLLFGITFVFALMFALTLVSATVTLVSPANGLVYSGDGLLINVTNSTAFADVVNCTLFGSSSLTANSTAVSLGVITNDSATFDYINGSIFNSTTIEDANNYVVYASCWSVNSTNQVSASNTITIDNSIPTASSSLSPTDNSVDGDGSVTFSGTVVGENTTSCTLRFNGAIPPGGNGQSMTHTGDTCSLTLTSIPDQTYDWFIRASDETNTTDSAEATINVDVKTSAGKAALLIQQKGVTSKGGALLSVAGQNGNGNLSTGWIVGIIVVVMLVVILVLRKRK